MFFNSWGPSFPYPDMTEVQLDEYDDNPENPKWDRNFRFYTWCIYTKCDDLVPRKINEKMKKKRI